MKDKVYKVMRKVKFNYSSNKFHLSLEKELREYVSDDVKYLSPIWNINDNITENIINIKRTIIESVVRNKYKKVYKI